jgi:hypothetical protein
MASISRIRRSVKRNRNGDLSATATTRTEFPPSHDADASCRRRPAFARAAEACRRARASTWARDRRNRCAAPLPALAPARRAAHRSSPSLRRCCWIPRELYVWLSHVDVGSVSMDRAMGRTRCVVLIDLICSFEKELSIYLVVAYVAASGPILARTVKNKRPHHG